MGRKKAVVPQLREFQGYATCWVNGKREYFGRFGSAESEEKFRSFVAQYAVNPASTPKDAGGILAHLIGGYLKSPDAPPSLEKKRQIAFLINHLGPVALKQVDHVSPQELKGLFKRKAEEQRPVKGGGEGEVEPKYSQTTLRTCFANLKRVYAWAIECKKISGDAATPILAIKNLPISSARREKDVEPVPREHVEATLKFLTPTVAAMVNLQLLTWMRPSDLFNMTGAEVHRGGLVKIGGIARDLDREGVWVYVRKVHKTARFGHVRVIVLGKEERMIVEPRLTRPDNVPLFQPFESFTESYRRESLDMKRAKPGGEEAQREVDPTELREGRGAGGGEGRRSALVAVPNPSLGVGRDAGRFRPGPRPGKAGAEVDERGREVRGLGLQEGGEHREAEGKGRGGVRRRRVTAGPPTRSGVRSSACRGRTRPPSR
ncbi:hypothetical protein [Limnoglobus roseus]|uniref:Site-specific integrase n=1 Tax=Limnoglobus roseus TaxID=2598579 RepID=A0A5C1AJZ3_9BACT|nr:hypothetical protein [Limnoglobus roseus]QEL18336.1 site-specific integrase [Limnoglobus roseus]